MSYNGKNPGFACFLSLLFVGGGQVYNEQFLKGVGFFVGAIVAGVAGHPALWLLCAIGSAIDAYTYANDGTSVFD